MVGTGARHQRAVQSGERRRRHAGFHASCGVFMLAMVAGWLVMRFAGDRSAALTVLLLMPRWPVLVVLGVLALWACFVRTWGCVVGMFLATWIAVVPFMGCRLALPPSRSDRGDVRVLTCNVHRRQLDAERLRRYIEEVRPDVVALQDWTSDHQEALFAGSEWNVKRLGELLVASRFTISSVEAIDIGNEASIPSSEQGEAAMFRLDTPRGPITIVNVHFASPHIGVLGWSEDGGAKLAANARRRWLESRLVRARLETVEGPLVVVGDFNTPPPSPILREHWSDLRDAFQESGSGCGYTYYNDYTQLRIDHLLAGKSWDVGRCFVGPFVGSPHRPVVGDLSYGR